MAETRRDRLRAATVREITRTARRILVEHGRDAVTLRAIARDMGMTAPALYRYFASHQELVEYVVGDVFGELTDRLHAAVRAMPAGDLDGRLLVASRTFRLWAKAHHREYELLFGTPLPGLQAEHPDLGEEAGRRFGWVFLTLFLELWNSRPFPVQADEDIAPELRAQLQHYRDMIGVALPLGTLLTFLQCWVRLQGSVSLEVFGHLDFALEDPEPLFELLLVDIGKTLGLAYSPPA